MAHHKSKINKVQIGDYLQIWCDVENNAYISQCESVKSLFLELTQFMDGP
jgi:hypothetical protein